MSEFQEPEDIDELRPYMEDGDEDVEVEPMDVTFPQCIAVDNLPKVDEAKKAKLMNVLKKIFGQVGPLVKVEMPMGADGNSLGFAFMEFETKEAAAVAVDKVNGYKLDKNHVFKVLPYSELARLQALPPAFAEPPAAPYAPRPDLEAWLADPAGRDQVQIYTFVIRHAVAGVEETSVCWGELGRPAALSYGGEREKALGLTWCDLEAKWSPLGSYLATFHLRGVALWGGDSMEKQGRYAHDGVNRLVFSPCERYMLTCNFRNPREGESTVLFWDVREAKVLRKFSMTFTQVVDQEGAEPRLVPNLFKWSSDGSYVAHMATADANDQFGANSLIKVYSLPSMQLLGSKSLRATGVASLEWSPADNTLAFWAAEAGNQPARVALVALPSRTELRQKNLFSVSDCQLTWHPNGHFLAVKVVRHTKSKKTLFNNLELFRVREASVPVETLDVKTTVKALAWEPADGTRFGLITDDGPKPTVNFYDMGPLPDAEISADQKAKLKAADKKPVECTLLKALPARNCSHLFWSPAGGFCVLAGIPQPNVNDYSGNFEFYDVDALLERGKEAEHYRANAVEWDPSGRMVATCVTQPLEGMTYKFQMDNGYHLWTFQGELFAEKTHEKFYSLQWRPRPQCLLDAAAKKAVVKNLRKFERKFERADKEQKRARDLKQMVHQQRERTSLRERLAARKVRNYDAVAAERAAARYGVDVDAAEYWVVTSEVREVVVNVKEDVVGVL